jgi:hypothetical protein
MELKELERQKATIEKEIEAIRTAEVRKSIADLEINYSVLMQKLSDAQMRKKTSDEEISNKIVELREEIERLKNLSFADVYFVSQIKDSLQSNGLALQEKQAELESLLSES